MVLHREWWVKSSSSQEQCVWNWSEQQYPRWLMTGTCHYIWTFWTWLWVRLLVTALLSFSLLCVFFESFLKEQRFPRQICLNVFFAFFILEAFVNFLLHTVAWTVPHLYVGLDESICQMSKCNRNLNKYAEMDNKIENWRFTLSIAVKNTEQRVERHTKKQKPPQHKIKRRYNRTNRTD